MTWIRTSRLRHGVVLALDGALAAFSLWASLRLRFDGPVPAEWMAVFRTTIWLLVGCRMASTLLLRLHRWSFFFSGLTDGARVGLSGLLGTGLFMSVLYLLRLQGPPRSVVVLELLLSTSLMATIRFLPRLASMYRADLARSRRAESVRTLIVGAGASGEMLLRDLQRSHEHSYNVVGFVDDDRGKRGSIVGGKPVLGAVADLPTIVDSHQIGKVLIAIPRLSAGRIREILSMCSDLKLRFKILPVSYIYLQDRVTSSMLQDLSPEDLLTRQPVTFASASEAISGRSALVTGAAGSIGSEICEQLLNTGLVRLIMVDMNENGLYLRKRRFTQQHPDASIVVEVADIREEARMASLFSQHRVQDVFHAAAHKHVPLMETAPCEAIKNNVLGTRNVAVAADRSGAERFVFISTDKAVRPSSVMGATKRLGEIFVRIMDDRSTTRFCAVRFGNVLDSAGSVVPLFREQIAVGGPVTVTHPEVRRYFMTITEAVGLVLKAAYGDFGHLCILDMGEQIRILDLARHMITMCGLAPDVDIPIVFTGLRPGEKLYEELLTEAEEQTRRVDQKISVALPSPPPLDFEKRLDQLIGTARSEDPRASLEFLRELVPGFHSSISPSARGEEPMASPGPRIH